MDHAAPLAIDTFLPYMRDVTRCEQSLHELNLMWRMIEASAKMNCPAEARIILPTMAATRAGFNRLEQELVSSLVREKVANVLDEIGTKAQYVIDIVVRNLYERTADAVLEALPAAEIAPVSIGGRAERIGVLSQQRVGESRHFVWVFDLRHLMRGKPSEIRNSSQVIIVRHGGQDIGLLVDELHGVPEFGAAQIVATPFATDADGLLVKQVIQANGGRLLIQALDVGQLFACLKDPSLPTVLDLGDVRRLTGGSYEQAVELMGEAA